MKKQFFKSGTSGILIGLAVSMIMSLIWAPSYMPLNPQPPPSHWTMDDVTSGSRIYSIGLLPHHLVCYRYSF